MHPRFKTLAILSIIVLLFILFFASQKISPSDDVIQVKEVSVSTYPTIAITRVQDTNNSIDQTALEYCESDDDCAISETCVEESVCPPCLDGDPYADCKCTTIKKCQSE